MFFRQRDNSTVDLGPPLGRGGQAQVFCLSGDPTRCVRISHEPVELDFEQRLERMKANPPGAIVSDIAWPLELICDGRGRVVGYIQERFGSPFVSASLVASPVTRPKWLTEDTLRCCAQQIALIVAELHHHSYLFPDLHPEQILVDPTGRTVLIDAASVQFEHEGQLFSCDEVRGEYQAPELLGSADWSSVANRRNKATDNYSLAVVIFQLAMGCHPFDGIANYASTTLSPQERSINGVFPFDKSCADYRPPKNAPNYVLVPEESRKMFRACFVDGCREADQSSRPTAELWCDALRHVKTLRADSALRSTRWPTSSSLWHSLSIPQFESLMKGVGVPICLYTACALAGVGATMMTAKLRERSAAPAITSGDRQWPRLDVKPIQRADLANLLRKLRDKQQGDK